MLNKTQQERLEAKAQKVGKKAMKLGYVLLVALGALFALYLLVKFNSWSQTHAFQSPQFRSPIVFRNPIVRGVIRSTKNTRTAFIEPVSAQKRIPTPTTVPQSSEKDIVLSHTHGEILWKVYALESSRGKADYCRIQGKGYGGFGVLNNGSIVCYDNFAKAVERAEYWLIQNGIENDIELALCKYNTGIASRGCIYYKSYLAL